MADRAALFKAAKAQRGSSSAMSKEQLKSLKAQKAKAAAEADKAARDSDEQRRKHETALKMAAAAANRQREGASAARPSGGGAMPPPAPRIPPTASNGLGSIGSTPAGVLRRTESQMTHVGRNASIAPEPAGQSNASSGAVHSVHETYTPGGDEGSIGSLPQGFFDAPTNSGGAQESVGTGEIVGSNKEASSEVASALPRGGSVEAISARTQVAGLPSDFFEAAASNDGAPAQVQREEDSSQPKAKSQKTGPLPKGFFEDKEADAKAQGVAPAKKKTKEEAYADFMTSIASDVKDAEEKEQEEASRAAQDREDREAFEQRMRLDRIETLRKGQTNIPENLPQGEAAPPKIDTAVLAKSRKRRLPDIKEEPSSAEESEDDEDENLNWRAKAV